CRAIVCIFGVDIGHDVFITRGTKQANNLGAGSFGTLLIGRRDIVHVTEMVHHSNIVPWQLLCERVGARLGVVPISDGGEIIYEEYERMLSERVKLVAVAHVSNTLGTINPIEQMIEDAHGFGIPVLIDGAQAVPHMKVDVRRLDADIYCFSAH